MENFCQKVRGNKTNQRPKQQQNKNKNNNNKTGGGGRGVKKQITNQMLS